MKKVTTKSSSFHKPPFRSLRGFAFDPITSLDLASWEINEVTYKIPWEDDLKEGPSGEYIKVIDRDPTCNAFYLPVDLNDPNILATNGLPPSETNPQFHQQMVYAVIMNTINNFEKAMGRKILWSPVIKYKAGKRVFEYVPQLVVYPHAFRGANAYYSADRKALLFGYYNAQPSDKSLYLPGGIVYSCLSHDIIAHETTHALLDSVYSKYMEDSNPDVAAFHEGFSDIVALLQHFTYPDIVQHQIKKVRGNLNAENLLMKLAVEFGISVGDQRSLRDSIGYSNEKGEWVRKQPNTQDYDSIFECHDRGDLLVTAVFDAFLAIYQNRTDDLFRLATNGTGVLPNGDIHPDLVKRLSDEAVKAASHVLKMCIRALDYCPPVDITFGDYLRALITADKELVANDELHYRIAFINAFRKRGIMPEGVPNLSVETLCYNPLDTKAEKQLFSLKLGAFLLSFKERLAYVTERETIFEETVKCIQGDKEKNVQGLHELLFSPDHAVKELNTLQRLTGLVLSDQYKNLGIRESATYKTTPSVEIHSMRILNRIAPDGSVINQIVLTLSQNAHLRVKYRRGESTPYFEPIRRGSKLPEGAEKIILRGGCTLIFDLNTLELRHAISKPIFEALPRKLKNGQTLKICQRRANMYWRCMLGDYFDKMNENYIHQNQPEPFAFLHSRQKTAL